MRPRETRRNACDHEEVDATELLYAVLFTEQNSNMFTEMFAGLEITTFQCTHCAFARACPLEVFTTLYLPICDGHFKKFFNIQNSVDACQDKVMMEEAVHE